MKRKWIALILPVLMLAMSTKGQLTRENFYTVVQVYTDPTIDDGDDIQVVGYYTDTASNLLLDFYGDYYKDQPFDPHTILTMTGLVPPENAWNGGYIRVSGTVTFVERDETYHPEDSHMAYLNAYAFTVYIPGESIPAEPENYIPRLDKAKPPAGTPMNREDCDPCKFAILISGGIDSANNHSKYWENLVALYQHKVTSMGYCDSNVFVHYFKGNPRDNRIPATRVIKADSAKIDSSMLKIANRVAVCNNNNTPATFQKMVTNHGGSNGKINLLGNKALKPDHMKALQQRIIDSCCRTVYDEFIQCYGGYSVDEMSTMDTKNKATVYINSNADKACGFSPHGTVHPYLASKITTLDTGGSYGRAVVNAKLAYDNYLQQKVQEAHNALVAWRASDPATPNREAQIAEWLVDSTRLKNAICKSRNVTLTPFTQNGQWQKYVVPPGGQLSVGFTCSGNNTGNVTVYKEQSTTGEKVKVREWNWNNPESARYVLGNDLRAINGDPNQPTTFWIRNDDGTSNLVVKALGTPYWLESPSNESTAPGFSFGGKDYLSTEFYPFQQMTLLTYTAIDQLNISLETLPEYLGVGYVKTFMFNFLVDPTDIYWSQMELELVVNNVITPGTLSIYTSNGSSFNTLTINEPGTFTTQLGNLAYNGTTGFIRLWSVDGLVFSLDSWDLRSTYVAPQTNWTGQYSSDWSDPTNWSDGVPGPEHLVTISPGNFQPVILSDVTVTKLTISPGTSVITAPGAHVHVTGP